MKKRSKKTRPRPRLTHFEIWRNDALLLRLAIANEAVSGVGEELGALIRKLAPGVSVGQALETMPAEELPIVAEHVDEPSHHADTRAHLAELVSSLCDTSLADAEEIVRNERARRMEDSN